MNEPNLFILGDSSNKKNSQKKLKRKKRFFSRQLSIQAKKTEEKYEFGFFVWKKIILSYLQLHFYELPCALKVCWYKTVL